MNYELLGKVMTLVLNDDYYEKSTVWGTTVLSNVAHKTPVTGRV